MRILLAIVLIGAVAWCGYWFLGAQTVKRGIAAWLEARQAEGWIVQTEAITTTGFPNRFDTTLSGLQLADPETGVAWNVPFFQILALSYKPHHVIFVWSDQQRLSTPYQTMTLTSRDLRGSMVFRPSTRLPLDRGIVEFANFAAVSTLDWQASAESGQLAVRRTPLEDATYDLSFRADNVVLPRAMKDLLDGNDGLAGLQITAQVAFDAPWDLRAIEVRRPQPRRIELELVRATWGDLDLRLAGELDVDMRGAATGEITVKATNWREMLKLAEAGSALPRQVFPALERGLATVARLSGNRDTIDVPLTFSDGRISLAGLIPLGKAPPLILR